MRTQILDVIAKPNYFKAEICTCGIPNQVRVIIYFMGALLWTQRCRNEQEMVRLVDSAYQRCITGNRFAEVA